LGSDSGYPRARHRFGFFGPLTRQKKDRVTSDDILDSLTRQAQLRQKLEERDEVRLEEIAAGFKGSILDPLPLQWRQRTEASGILRSSLCFHADSR